MSKTKTAKAKSKAPDKSTTPKSAPPSPAPEKSKTRIKELESDLEEALARIDHLEGQLSWFQRKGSVNPPITGSPDPRK